MKKYRAALSVLFGTIALLGALIAVFAWKPWRSEHEQEITWLIAYVSWADEISYSITIGDPAGVRGCVEQFEQRVGPAPPRLQGAARMALEGCRRVRALPLAAAEEEWQNVELTTAGAVLESHSRTSDKQRVPLFEPKALTVLERKPVVYCWNPEDWADLVDQFGRVSTELLSISGFAFPPQNRFHLGPETCGYLRMFFTTAYSPSNSTETVRLAEALIVFAHEAEHLRVPRASEAVVQCYALQRIRALALAEGRSRRYADELSEFAWDIVQPEMPDEYKTPRCRNGSALDLHPDTDVWP